MARLSKQPQPSSPPPNLPDSAIAFKHPHYSDTFDQNIIFMLQAYDTCDDRSGFIERAGLHCSTALIACGIVAGNAWNGYFTREKRGQKLELRHDDLLTDATYYFHIPTATEVSFNYPIYPSFDNWAFPHSNFPTAWIRPARPTDSPNVPSARSNVTAAVLQRDGTCVISGQRDYMEKAHLCPISEQRWFRINNMDKYNMNKKLSSDHSTDDVSNAVALRADIHAAFDDQIFVIVPKEDSWVPHFLSATHDLGRRYHNMALNLDSGVSVHHLLSRFAWAIFPLVQAFLLRGAPRAVRFRVFEEQELDEKTELMNAGAIKAKFFNKTRSPSPKKRKAQENRPEDEEDDHGRETKRSRQSHSGYILTEDPSSSTDSASDSTRLATSLSDPPDLDNATVSHVVNSNIATVSEGERAWQAGEQVYDKYIERISRRALLGNRPTDPGLYCCDYTKADYLRRRGVLGRREWGGSHLCAECLGGEYLPLAKDLAEVCDDSCI